MACLGKKEDGQDKAYQMMHGMNTVENILSHSSNTRILGGEGPSSVSSRFRIKEAVYHTVCKQYITQCAID